jgi:hypothetical protein
MKSILEQWKKKYREDSRPNCSGSCWWEERRI